MWRVKCRTLQMLKISLWSEKWWQLLVVTVHNKIKRMLDTQTKRYKQHILYKKTQLTWVSCNTRNKNKTVTSLSLTQHPAAAALLKVAPCSSTPPEGGTLQALLKVASCSSSPSEDGTVQQQPSWGWHRAAADTTASGTVQQPTLLTGVPCSSGRSWRGTVQQRTLLTGAPAAADPPDGSHGAAADPPASGTVQQRTLLTGATMQRQCDAGHDWWTLWPSKIKIKTNNELTMKWMTLVCFPLSDY